ncbi:hypothetical protein BDZ45DRAFT_674303 [Acephala macrosclerotiorum]|nr:hypothetical protein BDZ45DRAFT_674303 [Acephala macrosclerotiorum]
MSCCRKADLSSIHHPNISQANLYRQIQIALVMFRRAISIMNLVHLLPRGSHRLPLPSHSILVEQDFCS